MLKKYLLLFTVFTLYSRLSAQINLPQAGQISTGQVSARIQTTGALIDNFLVPGPAGDSSVSLLREVSLWMAGRDSGNNLFLAVQSKDSMNDEFASGFRGLPQSPGIWKVTRTQINAHLQDWQDNGHIDNPIPAIYAWPAAHNPFSTTYNGFATDTLDKYITAPFQDVNYDNVYNPDDGDFPFGSGVGVFHEPTEMIFTPFQVNMKRGNSYIRKQLDGSTLLFAYDCYDANFLEAAVFCQVSYVYKSTGRLDSFCLGFYVDGNIGGPHDDYIGSINEGYAVYFYNADNFDEGGFGAVNPLLAFHPFWLYPSGFQVSISPNSVMTIHPGIEAPPTGTDEPLQDIEYYYYLVGKWRDGKPLTFGGNGRLNTVPTPFIFPGNPAHPNEWSEVSAQNPPGDRRALLSFVQDSLVHNTYSRSIFSLTYIPPDPIATQIENMNAYLIGHSNFFYTDYFPPDPSPFDSISCLHLSATSTITEHAVRLFPNPAHDQLTLQTEIADIFSVSLYNILGGLEWTNHYPSELATSIQLPVKDVAPGLHLIQCVWKDGSRKTWKVLVE